MSKAQFQPQLKPIRLHVKYNPPAIAVEYKIKETDTKRRLYSILLNKLVFNPNPVEVARKLYEQHPHILSQKIIPVDQIARLVEIIQHNLQFEEEEDEEYDLGVGTKGKQQANQKIQARKFMQDEFDRDFDDEDDNPKLNHSR